MNFIEHNGKILLRQYEGNRQLASVLAESAQMLLQRFTTLLAKALRRNPGAYPF